MHTYNHARAAWAGDTRVEIYTVYWVADGPRKNGKHKTYISMGATTDNDVHSCTQGRDCHTPLDPSITGRPRGG